LFVLAGSTAVIRRVEAQFRRHVPSRASLLTLLLFAYGATVGVSPFLIGGASDAVAVAILQLVSIPVFFAASWIASARRASLIPAFAFAPILGVTASVSLVVASPDSVADAVTVAGVIGPSVAGFTLSWVVLGYVAGTAWHWRGRRRVPRRELGVAITTVLVSSGLAAVSYALFWSWFVFGLGDVVQ
jgi:hypothetical protein